jgi:hypothetical protein
MSPAVSLLEFQIILEPGATPLLFLFRVVCVGLWRCPA